MSDRLKKVFHVDKTKDSLKFHSDLDDDAESQYDAQWAWYKVLMTFLMCSFTLIVMIVAMWWVTKA